jgi:hypothetical protein
MPSIPEHDILDAKTLLLRATFTQAPREEERRLAAEGLLDALLGFHGLHGMTVERVGDAAKVGVPGMPGLVVSFEGGWFYVSSEAGWRLRAPLFYDAAFKVFVGPELAGAPTGRNGSRPRQGALPALVGVLVGHSANVSPER